jgi:hypothetical protein
MKEKEILVYTTEPHAGQNILLIDDGARRAVHNEIFIIRDAYDDDREVGMTGEELEDLCRWWLKFKKGR